MKKGLGILLAGIAVIVLALVMRGSMVVSQVRQQEAQLQQAIERIALPGTQLARQPDPIPASHIWAGWLLQPTPSIGSIVEIIFWSGNGLRWKPDRSIHMRAVYRSDETPEAIHTRYLEKLQPIQNEPLVDGGYFLSTQLSDIRVHITIAPREFLPNGDIVYPTPGASPETVATAVEISAFPLTPAQAEQFMAYP